MGDGKSNRDHPRLCGEKVPVSPKVERIWGSPPPMRGKVSGAADDRGGGGITPAYAGKSSLRFLFHLTKKDHPRLCGEKPLLLCRNYGLTGSPPPMRGKAADLLVFHVCWRITPAYAGKSVRQRRTSVPDQDHPRLCGEKTKKIPKQRYFFHQLASFSFSLQYT